MRKWLVFAGLFMAVGLPLFGIAFNPKHYFILGWFWSVLFGNYLHDFVYGLLVALIGWALPEKEK